MVSALLAAGAEVNATNNEGLTAIHFAATSEIAQLLLSAGATSAARTSHESPVETATRLGHFDALKVLTNAFQKTNVVGEQHTEFNRIP